ncbi:MAG: hypothetical protein ACOY46_11435 [Bacillota bacterium]
MQHLTVSNHGFLRYTVITSKEFWNGLPPMNEVSLWEMEQAGIINERDMKKLRDSGKVQIHIQTPGEREEWKKALKGVDEKLVEIAGPELAGEIISKTGR